MQSSPPRSSLTVLMTSCGLACLVRQTPSRSHKQAHVPPRLNPLHIHPETPPPAGMSIECTSALTSFHPPPVVSRVDWLSSASPPASTTCWGCAQDFGPFCLLPALFLCTTARLWTRPDLDHCDSEDTMTRRAVYSRRAKDANSNLAATWNNMSRHVLPAQTR